jgi:hypothetical protein
MPTRVEDDDRFDDGSESDDSDDPQFAPDDDEIVTVPCPYCREPIWEEAESCEHCGRYLSQEGPPWRRPLWLIVGAIACLFAVYVWIRRGR